MKGAFITFEGSEGCGKSTQAKLLYGFLKRKGCKVIFLREPGGTKISEKIRKILLDKKNDGMSPISEMLLYMAARAQVMGEIIRPALGAGKIVLCDRFLDSTIAYQGYGLGMDIGFIKSIGKFVTQGLQPDLTILLDMPLKEAFRCRAKNKDRIEERSLSYHKRVLDGYFKLAAGEPGRIKVVKVLKFKAQTQTKIRKITADFLGDGI
ncbi:MAG: dTMP kinase [Candidatus Omnitrophica bacterium]|nr:dTMP kinase [Candidatus Omnitrophota bacterium]